LVLDVFLVAVAFVLEVVGMDLPDVLFQRFDFLLYAVESLLEVAKFGSLRLL
jgi:hypothetical protein